MHGHAPFTPRSPECMGVRVTVRVRIRVGSVLVYRVRVRFGVAVSR